MTIEFLDQTKALVNMPGYKAISHIPGWTAALISGTDKIGSTSAAYAYVPLIYRALRLRCDNLASVPQYFERGKTQVEWPWPETDLYELIWKTEASLLLAGAAYWLKRNNQVRTRYIEWLNPFGMTVQTKKVEDRVELEFVYSWTNGNNTQTATYSEDEIVYFKEFNPRSDVDPGIGAASVTLTAAGLRRYATRFASYFFEGGAMPALLLGIPQTTTDAERDRTENWFKRKLTGIANAFRVIAVKAGMIDVKLLTPPIKDLVIPELNTLALEDISAGFGIRKSILGDSANYATSKEDWDSFWKTTIRPRGRFYEGVINRQLLQKPGLKIRFAFDELDVFQEDERERANSLKALTDAGMPIDMAADVLGYDLDDKQRLRLAEIANKPEPQPVVQTDQAVEAAVEVEEHAQQDEERMEYDLRAELRRWERASVRRLEKSGSAAYAFVSDTIPAGLRGAIAGALESAKRPADVHAIFRNALQWGQYP